MKVALVHDYLREYGGAERVLEVLHSMYPDAPVYTAYYFADVMPESFKEWNIVTSSMQKWWGIRKRFLWYTYLVPLQIEQFDLRGYDLIISSSSFAAKGVLTNPGQKHVDYCHTPTRFVWKLNRTSNRWLIHTLLSPFDNLLRQWDFAAAQRVDYFIANSEVVKDRIKRFYKRDSEVIYPPIYMSELVDVSNKPGQYYLVVSRLERLKNIELIVSAFNELGLPLRIAGTGSQEIFLQSFAKKNIEFLGYVDDVKKRELYRDCKALIVSTENEDFGMTVPEVQSFGRPVIALRSGGYVESIVENKTGIFFNKADVSSLVSAVAEFENHSFDSEYIRKHSEKFSVKLFTEKMYSVIEKVVLQN